MDLHEDNHHLPPYQVLDAKPYEHYRLLRLLSIFHLPKDYKIVLHLIFLFLKFYFYQNLDEQTYCIHTDNFEKYYLLIPFSIVSIHRKVHLMFYISPLLLFHDFYLSVFPLLFLEVLLAFLHKLFVSYVLHLSIDIHRFHSVVALLLCVVQSYFYPYAYYFLYLPLFLSNFFSPFIQTEKGDIFLFIIANHHPFAKYLFSQKKVLC